MANNEVKMGPDFLAGFESNLSDSDQVIKFERHPSTYGANIINLVLQALFAIEGLSPTARRVLHAYIIAQDNHGRVTVKGQKIAVACEISLRTYYTAKTELADRGIIYIDRNRFRTQPEQIIVGDFVKQFLLNGDRKNLLFDDEQNLPIEVFPRSYSGGSYLRTKVVKPSVNNEPPKVYEDRYLSSLSSKESDTSRWCEDTPFHTHTDNGYTPTFESAFEPLIELPDPELLGSTQTRAVKALKGFAKGMVNSRDNKGFQLTPPGNGKKERSKSRKRRGSGSVPQGLLNQFLDFCYNFTSPRQRQILSDGYIIGRCSDVIAKLIGAGADMTQFDKFKKAWVSRGWMVNPSPDMILRNWFRVLNDEQDPLKDSQVDPVIENKVRQEMEQDIDKLMLSRAERNR